MKFYKVQWEYEGERDIFYNWTTNKRDAEQIMSDNIEIYEPDEKFHKITVIDVPTDKEGLLKWLNNNVYKHRID